MDIEKIMAMNADELDKRAAEIAEETRSASAERLEEINKELDAIEKRRAELKTQADTRARAAAAVANGAGSTVGQPAPTAAPSDREVRSSAEYERAFADYLRADKSEKAAKAEECRALLTVNAPENGSVPVPTYLEDRIRTAWDNDEVFRRVIRTEIPGNVKVGFEVSGTDASVHQEGTEAPKEETLVIGAVDLIADFIKKWLKVSDNVLSMGPRAFLDYLYDEIEYRIIKEAAQIVVEKIDDAPAQSTTQAVGVPAVAGEGTTDDIIDAEALLTDEARDVVVLMNRKTAAALKKAARVANYAQDPFDDLTYIPTSALKGYADAKDGETVMIIGDLRAVQANLPEGDNVTFKFDDLSLAEEDLVKIVGKMPAAIEVVGPGMLVKVTKGELESE